MSIVDCCLIIFRAKPILQCTINLSFVGINYCRNINMRHRRRRRSVVVVPFLLTSPVATTDSTSLSSLHVSFSCLSVSVVNHSSSRLYIADHVREAKWKASVINRWLLLFEPSRAEPSRADPIRSDPILRYGEWYSVFKFNAATLPTQPIRQKYIEIYRTSWCIHRRRSYEEKGGLSSWARSWYQVDRRGLEIGRHGDGVVR